MAALAYATQAAQRTDLRYRVGQGSSTEILADAELDACLESARREVNNRAPALQLGSFPTVADQQRYLISGFEPATKTGPLRVFWPSGAGGCDGLGLFPTTFGGAYDFLLRDLMRGGSDLSRIDEATVGRMARNWTAFQRYFGGRGWEDRDGYVWLDPIPTTTGTAVYWLAPIDRFATPHAVTTEWAEALMSWAEYKAQLLVAGKQSEVQTVQTGTGKSVSTSGGRVPMQLADLARRRAEELLCSPARVGML